MSMLRALASAALILAATSAQAQINNPPSRFTAPTAPTGTNNEQIATTRFVKNALAGASLDAAHIVGVVPIAHGGTACSVPSGTCLDNITGFSATGIMARTGAGTYAFRAITGAANEIDVGNGDGIAGNPALSLPAALTFTGKTVTGGTFTSGAFNGTLGATTPASAAVTTLNASGASALAALSVTTLSASGASTLAALSATTGTFSSTIHLPNNVPLQARNAANSGDVNVAYLDPSDVFQLGGGDNVGIASPQASSSPSTGALQVAGGAGIAGALYLGGSLHLPNNIPIQARNAANSLDINVAYLDAGNLFQIGGGTNVAIASAQASSSSVTGALQVAGGIYAGEESLFGKNVGIGTLTPATIQFGAGIGAGLTAGGAGTIHINPYVDFNDATSALVAQAVDQPGASTYGGSGVEMAIVGGIKSTHNDGSIGAYKVGTAGMATMVGATSGNGWGGYFLCGMEASSRLDSICIGVEIDINNQSGADKSSDLAHPAYGLQITGTSIASNTAALLLAGAAGAPQWNYGIVLSQFRAGTSAFGIDFAFDASNSFGTAAIRLPNNQTVVWKSTAAVNVNALYLDPSDIFQLGGGQPTAVPSTLNVVGGYISNGTNGVTCAGINAATFTSLNGIVTHC